MEKIFDNQNENYPIILIPDKIYNFLHKEIDESIIASELNIIKPKRATLIKPEAPSDYFYEKRERIKTEPTEYTGCIPIVFIASIIISFFVVGSLLEGLKFIIFGSLGYLVFFSLLLLLNGKSLIKFKTKTDFVKINKSPEELKIMDIEYKEKLNKYYSESDLAEKNYKNQLDKYYTIIYENNDKIKKALYLQNLKPRIIASRGNLSLKRGVAELKFLEKLDSHLKGLILVDMVPRFDWTLGNKIYNPDFTLICKETNLHIDIEIDEPYSLTEKIPIHYTGGSDESRNEFFLDNNWCVLRFSERQIIENTYECINTIKSIYHNLIEMNSSYYTNLNTEERWSYEESIIMQNNRYREKYLNKER